VDHRLFNRTEKSAGHSLCVGDLPQVLDIDADIGGGGGQRNDTPGVREVETRWVLDLGEDQVRFAVVSGCEEQGLWVRIERGADVSAENNAGKHKAVAGGLDPQTCRPSAFF